MKALHFLLIFFLVFVGIIIALVLTTSSIVNANCSEGASYSCSDGECYCTYSSVVAENASCPVCSSICEEKGSTEFSNAGLPIRNVPLDFERSENGSVDFVASKATCYCHCAPR